MRVSVGTFNLNNLFSRWNFSGALEDLRSGDPVGGVTVRYEFTDPDTVMVRTFAGRLVRAKSPVETGRIAETIVAMDVDVLAVQEVENIAVLRQFNEESLGGRYPHAVLVEGNDPRFIDVGVLSRLPLGAITSHQTRAHPGTPGRRVFSRDLLEVEVLDPQARRRLFTLYTTHLKSKFVPYPEDPELGRIEADGRRRMQAETIAAVIAARQRPDASYVLLGDMNDPPDSLPLAPMLEIEGRGLVDGLAGAIETRPPRRDPGGHDPATHLWTHRHKPTGLPAEYELFDQIWLSRRLADGLTGAWIHRREKLQGDGSDHDPAWVDLDV